MRIWTISFALGICLALQFPAIPTAYGAWLLLPALVVMRLHWLRPLAACLLGACWCLWRADLVLSDHLPAAIEGKDVLIRGSIQGIPLQTDLGTRFDLLVEHMQAPSGRRLVAPGKVRLNWYRGSAKLIPGETWQFKVRLKQPRGFSNPGSFDYEFWLFQNRIRATGYVRPAQFNRRLHAAPWWNIDRLRYLLSANIRQTLGHNPHTGTIVALAIGSRHLLDADKREVLRSTGTGHLLAISGLHVGIVAAMFFFIGRWGWSMLGHAPRYLAAQDAGCVIAVLAAGAYAALAGFSVPTQRALLMLLIGMGALLSRSCFPGSVVLAAAFLAVLLYDPLSLHTPGLWLSFCAIAFIVYGMSCRPGSGGLWWRWGRVQYLVAVGLLPVLMFCFQGASLISIPANLLAIPLVSLIVVPLILLAVIALTLQVPGAAALLEAGAFSLELLWQFLLPLSQLDFAWWQQGEMDQLRLFLGMAGALLLCLPRGVPARWPGVLWLLPLCLPLTERPQTGQFWLTLLDVGQGMAAVVETRHHVLVYDSGARFSDRLDAGTAVVLPYLGSRGIDAVDVLLISHGDNDHIGGAGALLQGLRIDQLVTSVPHMLPAGRARKCQAGQTWHWDAVRFEILHPEAGDTLQGNNASCVLRVSHAGQSVLLTGDIERAAENLLIDRYGGTLASTIMSVPHHGSKTSSSAGFVDTVHPQLALITAGYRNRYRFPKQAIMARYRQRGIALMNTARHGAITVRVSAARYQVRSHRRDHWRFWYSGEYQD